jgi:DNA-directed RNA polymerase specialized sigma24 family protein
MSDSERYDQIGALFTEHAERLEHVVARRVSAPDATVQDACGFAWAQLLNHPTVDLEPTWRVLGWLARVGEREAWRLTRQAQPGAIDDVLHLARRQASEQDVEQRAVDRLGQGLLDGLPERKQRILILYALGLAYSEIARLSRVADVASVEAAVVSIDDMSSTSVNAVYRFECVSGSDRVDGIALAVRPGQQPGPPWRWLPLPRQRTSAVRTRHRRARPPDAGRGWSGRRQTLYPAVRSLSGSCAWPWY